VLFTLAILPLLGMVGLVVDVGYAYSRKEAAQTAADAAAGAAASAAFKFANGSPVTCAVAKVACYAAEYTCPATLPAPPATPSDNIQAGCMYARDNGFATAGKRKLTFQSGVGAAPTAGGVTISYWTVARASEEVPQLFSAVLGHPTMTVVARATAGAKDAASGGCVYLLDPNANKSFTMTGGNFSTGCGIYVNSNKNDAAYMTGGNLSLNNGANLMIHGLLSKSGGTISPSGNVKQNQPSISDPFSGMTAPTPAGSCTADPHISGGNSNIIYPGTYCSITISGGNNIYFASGTYIVKSGSLTVSGGNFSSSLSNLLVYIPAGNSSGKINITGGNMRWTGPYGGSTDGLVFWVANSAAQNITGGNYTINGVTYMPSAALTYTGGNGTQQTVVAATLKVNGGNISAPASSSYFTGGGGAGGVFPVE
jgi:hypothetical protein